MERNEGTNTVSKLHTVYCSWVGPGTKLELQSDRCWSKARSSVARRQDRHSPEPAVCGHGLWQLQHQGQTLGPGQLRAHRVVRACDLSSSPPMQRVWGRNVSTPQTRTLAVKARCSSGGRCQSIGARLSSRATAPASLTTAFIACVSEWWSGSAESQHHMSQPSNCKLAIQRIRKKHPRWCCCCDLPNMPGAGASACLCPIETSLHVY